MRHCVTKGAKPSCDLAYYKHATPAGDERSACELGICRMSSSNNRKGYAMNEDIEPSKAQANQLSNAVKDVSFVLANAIEAASAATTTSAEI